MALTIVVPNYSVADLGGVYSSVNVKYVKLTGDTSYPNGTGYSITPTTVGFSNQIVAIQTINPANSTAYALWDPLKQAVRLFNTGTTSFSEVVSGSSVSAVILDTVFYGF